MDLSRLIDTHRGGRSYAELARDCGGRPSDKRLQQLVRQPIKNFPDPDTITALARGLRVSPTAVLIAAGQSLGLDVGTSMPRLLELLPAAADDLSEEQAAAIAHLVRTIVRPSLAVVDDEAAFPNDGPEPTVKEVLAAREREATRLRAVAQDGEGGDADHVDELARQTRERQDP